MMLLDGQTSDDALLGDRGLNYGDGVFKTIALRDGCLLSWGAQLGPWSELSRQHRGRSRAGACRARFAGNSGAIAKNCNVAAAAQEQPDVEIILTRVLRAPAAQPRCSRA